MASLRGLIEKLARPPEELRADNLQEWAASIEGTTRIADMTARDQYKIAGVVTNIRIDPREGSGYVEATVTDGTGIMVARWLGRQTMSGLRLGVGLILKGRCGSGGPDGELVIINPEYDLVPDPEHG